MGKKFSFILVLLLVTNLLLIGVTSYATNYSVSTLSSLKSKMNNAVPGDTVTVLNGTYNWGSILIINNHGSSTSAWIVLKAQTFNGVVFTGSTYLQFSGYHILVDGFKFANGNSGQNDVIQFRSSSNAFAYYSRITNITIDNYNSDSTGSSANTGTKNGGDTLNRWVSLYGAHNRVDHCTFINKYNGDPTVVIWYDSNVYTVPGTSTYHRIDSNYFKYRGYQGGNEGEVIRVGTSTNSRTNGYNIIEYNLFEYGVQVDPEIISNKSNFNTYRYNTFRDHAGGITLREGRYCSVYGNFFIQDANSTTNQQYGVRVIDKGHKVYNNYFEGLTGNYNSLNSLRCPLILFNGVTTENDSTNPAYAALYFPTDSCIVAFNTVVNCYGGAGVVVGYNNGGANTFQPKGIVVANNLIKMAKGQALLVDTTGSNLTTYFAEGNLFKAPNGLGMLSSTGFTSKTLTFGSRTNGILMPPSLVQDAAVNTNNYTSLLAGLDGMGHARTSIYDVGSLELNGTGSIIASPLDSTMVGAGKPLKVLPVLLLDFNASRTENKLLLNWNVENEFNFHQYDVEYSADGLSYKLIGIVEASNQSTYAYSCTKELSGYFRLKLINNDGSFTYSNIILINAKPVNTLNVYPNPAINIISLHTDYISPTTSLRIVDALGNAIRLLPVNSTTFTVSVATLLNGYYSLQLIDDQHIISQSPLIISR